MTISFPVQVPSLTQISAVRFSAVDVVGVGESPFTLSQEIHEHQGKRWGIEVQLVPMVRADAEAWIAFLLMLRGRRGTFELGDPVGQTPRGAATGSPLVKGASQVGGTLATDGWTAGVTGIVKAGDWIQIGSTKRLHKVLQDANSDGSTNATLELWPGPRVGDPPGDNDVITVSGTKGTWRLAANERGWDVQVAQVFGLRFAAVEAL